MILCGCGNLRGLGQVLEVSLLKSLNQYDHILILGNTCARCTLCSSDFSIAHGGRNDVTTHVKGKHHKDIAMSVVSFLKPQGVIQAEAMWAMFVVEHNLAFKASDHATKLFRKMFPDSEVAKKFACGRTKTTAIIKGALAPHFSKKTLENLQKNGPFSVLMDESNDKTNKSSSGF